MFRSILLFCTLFAAASSSLSATTYYVSPYGCDFCFGTSPLLPWATIAKVNGANLRSGDQVYFLRGGTWRETIVPQTSGLYYGAYGTGDRPVISGADQLTSAWTSAGKNIWSYNLGSITPTQVWFHGVAGNPVASSASVLAPLQWFYGQGKLYAYATSSPASQPFVTPQYQSLLHLQSFSSLQSLFTSFIQSLINSAFQSWASSGSNSFNTSAIEATQRATSLMINNVSSITVEHLALVNTGLVATCMCTGNTGQGVFNDDIFSGALNEGFSAYSGTATINASELINNGIGLDFHSGSSFTLANSIVSGNASQGILVNASTLSSQISNSTITGNATDAANVETITNLSAAALTVGNSILLPNPYMPKVFNYSGITDLENNVYQSAFFKTRSAPLIVVPFIDDYNNLAVAQAVSKVAASYGCPISYALNTKLVTPAAWTQIAQMQSTYGVEVVAHTRSHSDLANNNVFSIQYTGPAATATMTINQTTARLQTFLNGSTTPDLNLDLSNTYNGIVDVLSLIPAGSPYTIAIQLNQNFFTPINLAAVTSVNIKTAPYLTQASANYLNWEVEGAQSDIAANLPGYHPKAFATPFTSSNLTVENHVRDAGFASNRNGTLTAASLPNGNWLLSNLDVYNMASEFLPIAFDATKVTSSTAALVEGLGAAGGVMAVYAHGYNEFTLQNWTDLFTNLKALNATCMTMSQANAYIEAQGQLIPDGTKKNWTQIVPLIPDFTITSLSPTQGARSLE